MIRSPARTELSVVLVILIAAMLVGTIHAASNEKVSHHGVLIDADRAKSCISCHDGSVGPYVSYCRGNCNAARQHVVFRHYPPRGKEKEFVPAAVVRSKGIVFEKGQVTCISCHNVRNSAYNHLVVEKANSKLCLTCHIH